MCIYYFYLESDIMTSELPGYFELLTAMHVALQDLVSRLISFPASAPTPLLCSDKVCYMASVFSHMLLFLPRVSFSSHPLPCSLSPNPPKLSSSISSFLEHFSGYDRECVTLPSFVPTAPKAFFEVS